MCVHVFGNTPSPAVATFGLRQAAITAGPEFGKDVYEFIQRNFYVDDALVSLPSTHEAVDLLQRTQQALMTHGGLRLLKIASRNPTLMQHFPTKDLARDLIDLDFTKEELPEQRRLGLVWDLQTDSFGFRLNLEERPYTRRGVLSCVNSLYDPLGFIAPITIQGKILLTEMMQSPCIDWDADLPEEYLSTWLTWTHSLSIIEDLKVPLKYLSIGFSELGNKQVLIFSDASELAISAVAYLHDNRDSSLGFIIGKSKVAPRLASSVPCFKIVLGYIHNHTKRFLTYVSNRIQRILNFTSADHWNFIATNQNPADHGTKPTSDRAVYDSWICGPFSSRRNLVHAIASLKLLVRRRKRRSENDKQLGDTEEDKIHARKDAEEFIIRLIQSENFGKERAALKDGKILRKDSWISKLDPFLNNKDILQVGGRLRHSEFDLGERNPILMPGKHRVSRLLVVHHHEETHHQGRHITEGAIRNAGWWITGAKRLISSIIHKCVKCRRGRGKFLNQKMADLPPERLKSSPPFTYVGIDCFGPWNVTTRKTRGGSADSKRWAVLFTCLCSRAVHIEVIEQMSTPSFINALRRFYATRGAVKEFYSDKGTNFIGAVRELGICSINVEDPPIQNMLTERNTVWKFNTPYSSHMGGTWERLIGIRRRILDAILLEVKHTKLTHEVLCTFFVEVVNIINNRPLIPVSSDSDLPSVLTPNVLLTQKIGDVSDAPLNLNVRDLYTSQWKIVQVLADRFWERWRKQYLQSLQSRNKWKEVKPNIQVGDVVILKDNEQHRNLWPLSRVTRVFPSRDDLVRKVEVVTFADGIKHTYVRPITHVIPLL
ncbi:uncharacterized protein LOC130053556 [Ostrea edulis]|uniref:uncharacterized protein LOC130053556 n=1 Tax=Ostrea edulis TaxID=37623 RepID=UPI0024AFCEE9|nr:uncharacterized protein LOC130053556 [Ostrea edulis]